MHRLKFLFCLLTISAMLSANTAYAETEYHTISSSGTCTCTLSVYVPPKFTVKIPKDVTETPMALIIGNTENITVTYKDGIYHILCE